MEGTYVGTEVLMEYVSQVTSHVSYLSLLIIKDLVAEAPKWKRTASPLPGDGHFQELVFDNVKYIVYFPCGHDDWDVTSPA